MPTIWYTFSPMNLRRTQQKHTSNIQLNPDAVHQDAVNCLGEFYLNKNYELREDVLNSTKPNPDLCQLILSHSRTWIAPAFALIGAACAAACFKNSSEFKGFTIKSKMGGKDPGFILENPINHQRWFFKKTNNEVMEYFISKCFTYLGVKYPETRLIQDVGGNFWLATLDMSRSTDKGGKQKVKQFETMQGYFDKNTLLIDPTLANTFNPLRNESNYALFLNRVKIYKKTFSQAEFDFPTTIGKLSKEQRELCYNLSEKLVSEDKKTIISVIYGGPQAKQARITFAKILILKHIFLISDLGHHANNLGIIKINQSLVKIGLVDFAQIASTTYHLHRDTFSAPQSLQEMFTNESDLKNMFPILRELTKLISVEEITQTFDELVNPKERQPNAVGYLLTTGKQSSFEDCLQRAFDDLSQFLNSAEIGFNGNELLEKIDQCKELYSARFKALQTLATKNEILQEASKTIFKPQQIEWQVTYKNENKPHMLGISSNTIEKERERLENASTTLKERVIKFVNQIKSNPKVANFLDDIHSLNRSQIAIGLCGYIIIVVLLHFIITDLSNTYYSYYNQS